MVFELRDYQKELIMDIKKSMIEDIKKSWFNRPRNHDLEKQ